MARLAGQRELPDSSCVYPLSTGVMGACCLVGLLHGLWDLNSGPCACAANPSPAEPSPQPVLDVHIQYKREATSNPAYPSPCPGALSVSDVHTQDPLS